MSCARLAAAEGRALCPVLRCLRHPDRYFRRCARLPAGHRAGIWRLDQAWRETAVRLFAMHGAAGDDHHPESLWLCLQRDGVEGNRRRHELRVADRPDRRDGRQARGGIIFHSTSEMPTRSPRGRGTEDPFLSPFIAAERGYIDDVIMPHSTRRRIARAGDAQGQACRDADEEARQFAVVRQRSKIRRPQSSVVKYYRLATVSALAGGPTDVLQALQIYFD